MVILFVLLAGASGREYVKKAMSGERVIDYIEKSRGDKKSLIVMTVPLYDKNEVIAAAFGTFDSGDFMRNRKTEGGYSLLADNSGRILFGMENNRFINAENIQNNFDNEVIQKREGTFRYKINSEDCFVTYLPLGYNGWMMIDVIPGTQIINRLSGYTRLILIFIIEIVLISSGVFIIIGRFIGLKNLKNETNKLKKLSRTDGLTGLYNRHGFVEKVKGIIEKSGNCSIHAMLIIDLDNFKQVNDTDGHMAGDDMLCRVAAIMENAVRESDIIGRLGGDEFVVFLKNVGNNSAAEVIAERICGGIEYKIETRLNISCSIGIAMYPSCGDCYEDLYRFADKALYCAKDQGKNRWCFSSGNVG